jgi:hypothetical protein
MCPRNPKKKTGDKMQTKTESEICIAARTKTTDEGLDHLANLIRRLSKYLVKDQWNLESEHTFAVKVRMDNDRASDDIYFTEDYSDYGVFIFINGWIKMRIVNEKYGWIDEVPTSDYVDKIYKINFAGAISSLRDLIDQYNNQAAKKDEEIAEFLKMCAKVMGDPNRD